MVRLYYSRLNENAIFTSGNNAALSDLDVDCLMEFVYNEVRQ